MKKVIIHILSEWTAEKQNSMIQAASNQGFLNFFATGAVCEKLSKIDRIKLYSSDLERKNIIPVVSLTNSAQITSFQKQKTEFGVRFTLSNKEDERNAIQIAKTGINFLIANATNWKVIPFENLIANLSTVDVELIAEVGNSLGDVDLLFHTLEKGVHGVLFSPASENDLVDLKKQLRDKLVVPIESAKIIKITSIPEADRVCIDTSSMLRPGEGMLVGNTARGFALVHAEVFESEFVNSRPFRVNAGDVSDYVLVPQFEADGTVKTRTNYLSEVKAGDRVLIVNTKGETRIVSVGRVKIETRPMLLFELMVEHQGRKVQILATIQNAETVRLIRGNGEPISGTILKPGDEVLVHVGPGATHFGTAIKETIIEK